jgi:hypothetical protein
MSWRLSQTPTAACEQVVEIPQRFPSLFEGIRKFFEGVDGFNRTLNLGASSILLCHNLDHTIIPFQVA